jgi:branched-chain amino acid transport system permease protein
MELVTFSLLNGVVYGLLLFMLSSGLTLIFSMMGVLNFAHASVFMLGAYFSFQLGRWIGFLAGTGDRSDPVRPGGRGDRALRAAQGARDRPRRRDPVHVRAFVPDRGARDHGLGAQPDREPRARDDRLRGLPPLRHELPVLQGADDGDLGGMFAFLYLAFKRTRVGLVIQAALTHPQMVGALGHDVPRLFVLVFAIGSALAGLAGVIGGFALLTEPNMAASLGPIVFVVVVVGGLGSIPGAFIASMLIGIVQTFAVALDYSTLDLLRAMGVTLARGSPFYELCAIKLAQAARSSRSCCWW